MAEQTTKPKGTFAKLMSSSPLQEEQERLSGIPENLKTGIPENLKTGNQENRDSGKPENLKTGIPENLKAIKYCTQLHKNTIIRLRQYALVNEIKDYKVVEDAITEYLDKRQSGKPENLKT